MQIFSLPWGARPPSPPPSVYAYAQESRYSLAAKTVLQIWGQLAPGPRGYEPGTPGWYDSVHYAETSAASLMSSTDKAQAGPEELYSLKPTSLIFFYFFVRTAKAESGQGLAICND